MCGAGGGEGGCGGVSVGIGARISWYNIALRLLLPWQNEMYDFQMEKAWCFPQRLHKLAVGRNGSSKLSVFIQYEE